MATSPLPQWAPTPSPSRPLWRWGGGTPEPGTSLSIGSIFSWGTAGCRRHPAPAAWNGACNGGGELTLVPEMMDSDADDPGVFLTWEDVRVTVAGRATEILDGISGGACPGEVLAIMGPSGCGKTTLLDTLAGPSSYQHFNSTPGSYHGGPYQGNIGQYPPGMFGNFASNGPASPVGSIFFGASGGSSSRDESSPITSASPAQRVPPIHPAPVIPVADDSESSTDDGGKKRGRTLWSEDDNIRLASAWLKNSNDPIDGNGKHRERYWKEVAAEYNKTAPKNKKRTALQCKEHWNKNIPLINKFNGFYNDIKNTYASGQSEDQLMEKVRAKWKSVMQKNRPFPLEHWWSRVKNEPKWARTYSVEEVQKRIRLNSAGAYSSSSAQDTDGASAAEPPRPQGRDAAKAERKNKGKRLQSISTFTDENMQMFNELQLRKSAAAEKMAEAAIAQAAADKEKAEAEKEKAQAEKERVKMDKLAKYLDLIEKDTSGYNAKDLAQHEQVVAFLAMELFPSATN